MDVVGRLTAGGVILLGWFVLRLLGTVITQTPVLALPHFGRLARRAVWVYVIAGGIAGAGGLIMAPVPGAQQPVELVLRLVQLVQLFCFFAAFWPYWVALAVGSV